jgi:hypothetical protein
MEGLREPGSDARSLGLQMQLSCGKGAISDIAFSSNCRYAAPDKVTERDAKTWGETIMEDMKIMPHRQKQCRMYSAYSQLIVTRVKQTG